MLCWLLWVRGLEQLSVRAVGALREKRFQKKKAPFPFSLLLPLLERVSGRSCVDVVVSVFSDDDIIRNVAVAGRFGQLQVEHGSVDCL